MNIPEKDEENDLDPRVEHACQELEEILVSINSAIVAL